ncbi:MAG: YgiQ family radical SAM protein [Firmicutes bacterium]|jgi:uncharacterized radical SAM protein YgiQ|nr:YgiQ family radical SAM protein [Bacillota bacterium]
MFLPITREEMNERGWDEVDFVLVTGDAYVDHHSFGTAIIGRVLESRGYKVAVLPRPDYKSADDFKRFGKPRLGFLINSGVVDSMVNNYSVFKHKRKKDEYAPAGKAGGRPDRALIVYANRAREAYKGVPIIIGGIEASLRRLGHYDYWSDTVRRSILLDSKADLLIYGMGEKAVVEIADALDSGIEIKDITWIKGTCYKGINKPEEDWIILPQFEQIKSDKKSYAGSFAIQYKNNDAISAKGLAEKYTDTVWVMQNPPQEPLNQQELDDVYALPFENEVHPSYKVMGGIPAFEEVKFSIVSSRGCFGGCSFCAITYHQGRQVRARSKEAIVEEARRLTKRKDFKGYIHDVGGPTANFRGPACDKQLKSGVCTHRDCLYPSVCPSIKPDHSEYFQILRSVRQLPGIKKVFIRSGIRYDYLLADPKCDKYIEELCKYHVSGTLKVAPEHVSDRVLSYMHKPPKEDFIKFTRKYKKANEKLGLKQYLIPYLISSHPGSSLEDGVELALFLKEYGFVPDQVQDFYPTPGTLATCMYYTGLNPLTMEEVYVAKSMEEKKMQRALIHFHKKENRGLVEKALARIGRKDLFYVLISQRHHKSKRM